MIASALAVLGLVGCTTPGVRAPVAHRVSALPPPAALSFASAQQVAVACARQSRLDIAAFAACTRRQIILTPQQQAILDCAIASSATEHFAECAAPQLGITLTKAQIVTTDCAMHSSGLVSRFGACTGLEARRGKVTPRERALLGCAKRSEDQPTKFSACSARWIVGDSAPREQRIALDCAASTGANYAAFVTCAGANLFNVRLGPDQTIAIECILAVGGVPFAAVGCMATRFLQRELRLCAAKGFGGAHGCFGDSNTLIGRNGWTARTLAQIAARPGSVMRDPTRLWGGTTGLHDKAHLVWVAKERFIRNSAEFWRNHAAAVRSRWQAKPVDPVTPSCTPWCSEAPGAVPASAEAVRPAPSGKPPAIR